MPDPTLFITPAIIISAIAYFARFFGKIIADQKPFADDRKWEIELNGFVFMFSLITTGLIGFFFGMRSGEPSDGWVTHSLMFMALALITYNINLVNDKKRSSFYKLVEMSKPPINKYEASFRECATPYLEKIPYYWWFLPTFFVIGVEYSILGIGHLWFWIIASQSVVISIRLGILASYQSIEQVTVNIHFTGNREPLKEVLMLKHNEHNVRLRVDDSILIINNSEIVKIEMRIPDRLLKKESNKETKPSA